MKHSHLSRTATLVLGVELLAAALTSSSAVAAQCDSMVAAALTPMTERSPFSWALELDYKVGSVNYGGYNKDTEIFMALAALEWDIHENSRLYFEAGVKEWNRSGNAGDGVAFEIPGFGHIPYADDGWRSSTHTGLRELYWEWSGEYSLVRMGLQSMASREGLLLDERVLGAFFDYQLHDTLSLQMGVGTVDKDYSRMGKFCASRHSYRPLSGYYTDAVSDELGESNLAFIDLYWKPGVASTNGGNEFEAFEEFEPISDGANVDPVPLYSFEGAGINVFSQFGDAFDDESLMVVGYTKWRLFDQLQLKASVGTDMASDLSNYVASVVADYAVIWDSGASLAINAGGWYLNHADEEGRFNPAFSNLFLGEVAKLDLSHGPLLDVGASYTLPTAWPVFAGIRHVWRTEGEWVNETDYQIGFRPRLDWSVGNVEMARHLSVVGTYFKVDSETLAEVFDGWRVELRWAF